MDRFVVRQAIKEAQEDKVIGYELLFQEQGDGFYDEAENSAADTIKNFLMQNSSKLFNEGKTFITFTPSLLFRNVPKIFEKEKIVIQIEDNLVIHPLAAPIIKKYCDAGYEFAINNFQFSPKYFAMLDYAEYVGINVEDADELDSRKKDSLDNIVRMAQSFSKKCIAKNVNSKEAYELAKELHVDFLQGNYIAESTSTKAERLEYLQGNFFQLVVAVSKDEPDLEEIEGIISRDAGLTYALLKMVNSAYFALRRRTASIRQALVTLGIGRLRQWSYMLSMNPMKEDPQAEELLKVSFLRANFAAELTEKLHPFPITKPEAYMMGMFSTLEYLVSAPLDDILQEIPISEEIKVALLELEGKAGVLYRLVLAYEKADWKNSKVYAEELGIDINTLAQIYVNCVEEVNAIWEALTTDYDRPNEGKNFDIDDKKGNIEDQLK